MLQLVAEGRVPRKLLRSYSYPQELWSFTDIASWSHLARRTGAQPRGGTGCAGANHQGKPARPSGLENSRVYEEKSAGYVARAYEPVDQ